MLHDRLSRFEVSKTDPNRAEPGSEAVLINQFDLSPAHNGGSLAFGSNGYLYVALGDVGLPPLYLSHKQSITDYFFMGILRLDVDEQPGNLPPNPHIAVAGNYRVPADNPFVGALSFNGRPVEPDQVRRLEPTRGTANCCR
jgi:glucose/arabinose dehydrogenase